MHFPIWHSHLHKLNEHRHIEVALKIRYRLAGGWHVIRLKMYLTDGYFATLILFSLFDLTNDFISP